MKKLFLIFTAAILLVSCSVTKQTSDLKPQHNIKTEFVSQNDYDKIWDNIIDLFTKNEIPISVVDKVSGLIISSEISFNNHYTFEKDGKSLDTNAWICLNKLKNVYSLYGYGSPNKPNKLNASWNIVIKKLNSGETSIKINIVNIDARVDINNGRYGRHQYSYVAKSTGVFEQTIFDKIK